MNNLKTQKLSEKLSAVFDQMDKMASSYTKIERTIKEEYKAIQDKLNPDKDEEIAKELNHHFNDFITRLLKDNNFME